MNALWEQLAACKEKVKELESKLDSANKEISQIKRRIGIHYGLRGVKGVTEAVTPTTHITLPSGL